MSRIPISQCICPSCGIKLETLPSRKKRCTSCKKYIYVRTTVDRNKYLVTEDELEAIEREWSKHYESTSVHRTEEDYECLFQMPLSVSIERKSINSERSLNSLFSAKPVPVRWVLGPWCDVHCRRIAGHPSCHDLAGEWPGGWDSLPCVPAGGVACHSDEFIEWWCSHHSENEQSPCCDCNIEIFRNGNWEKVT